MYRADSDRGRSAMCSSGSKSAIENVMAIQRTYLFLDARRGSVVEALGASLSTRVEDVVPRRASTWPLIRSVNTEHMAAADAREDFVTGTLNEPT